MDFLYSLYDALVSIGVPNDKARAVVDTMERDMSTHLATKADLQFLKQELTALIDARDAGSQKEFASVRQEILLIRKDMEIMAADLSLTLTVRLGSMMVICAGLLFAALKLT